MNRKEKIFELYLVLVIVIFILIVVPYLTSTLWFGDEENTEKTCQNIFDNDYSEKEGNWRCQDFSNQNCYCSKIIDNPCVQWDIREDSKRCIEYKYTWIQHYEMKEEIFFEANGNENK